MSPQWWTDNLKAGTAALDIVGCG